jgi:hypothetical protein
VFDLDKQSVDFQCPQCGFYNSFLIKQARLRDVIICRGCKANIHLDDGMNETRKAVRSIKKALEHLYETVNKTFTITI